MKLTTLFALATTALAVLMFAMEGRILWGEWQHYRAAQGGLYALQLVQQSMAAAEKISYERGPVNGVLGDGEPADPAKRAGLAAARLASDQALAQLERELAASPLAAAVDSGAGHGHDGAPAANPSASLRSSLAAARREIDALAALPRAERAPARLTAAVEQMFALVPRVLATVGRYTAESEQAYPRISKLLMKARLAVELREYAGRLGSRLTVALTRQLPLTPTEQAQMEFLRGQVHQLRLLIELPDSGEPAADVARAERAMDQVYFGQCLAIVRAVEADSLQGRPYGMDTAQFAQRYVPCMRPILDMRDVLLGAAQAQAAADYEAVRRELLLACLSGAAILLTLTLLMLIVRRRVLVPLMRATRATIRLGNGDFSRDAGGSSRPDEIGDLLRALSTLRHASIDKQRLEQERECLMAELRQSADTDYLTGILNRRAFTAAGNQRLRGAQERSLSLAVILFDIDRFKTVNDSYGHDAGDQVLVRVAEVARRELRDGEILARYGGEEFVIMPSYCSLAQAQVVAERLRAAIAAEPILLADGRLLRVTASFGVAASSGQPCALDTLFHDADLALYRAKAKGRDRVEA
jgi:diguanylate cyclase (GGDEF)-like protein